MMVREDRYVPGVIRCLFSSRSTYYGFRFEILFIGGNALQITLLSDSRGSDNIPTIFGREFLTSGCHEALPVRALRISVRYILGDARLKH